MTNVTVIDKEGTEHEMSVANSFDMVNHMGWTVKTITGPSEAEIAAEKAAEEEAAATAILVKAREDEEAALSQKALEEAADASKLREEADAAKALEAAAKDQDPSTGRRRGKRSA
jgi:parvulin-like peptidyl-prolyl isomerase